MEQNFDVFYGSVCHLCKSREVTKFCSGCRLVCYCCRGHQQNDWPSHREFCKSIQQLLKRSGTDHIYQEARDLDNHDTEGWNKLRVSVTCLVKMILKRPLTSVESQIILFPAVCNVCRSYEQNKMLACGLCNSVLYCSVEHLEKDLAHTSVCKNLSLSFSADMLRFFRQRAHLWLELPPAITDRLLTMNHLPKNIESLLNFPDKCLSSEDYLLSEYLSYPLTLLFAIVDVGRNTEDSLTVHIVGADAMEVLAFETLYAVFGLIPHISHINIKMIGPNLLVDVSNPVKIYNKCSIQRVNMFYHKYVASTNYTCPNVIAVFNCGFCEFVEEPDKDIWRDSLPYILCVPNCTVVLTSYTNKEAVVDLKRIFEMKRTDAVYKLMLETDVNPFGSLYPHRDWEAACGGVFYVNKYVSVLTT